MDTNFLEEAAFGFRLTNTATIKLLHTYITQIKPKFKINSSSDACAVLYQLKYWFDLKCRENKKKHHFYKSAVELHEELPNINIKSIKNHLELLDKLEIVYRWRGGLAYNRQIYTYELNLDHPLVLFMYVAEGMNKFTKAKTKNHKGESVFVQNQFLKGADIDDIRDFIDNKIVRYKIPDASCSRGTSLALYVPTVGYKIPDYTNTKLRNNIENANTTSDRNRSCSFSSEKISLSPISKKCSIVGSKNLSSSGILYTTENCPIVKKAIDVLNTASADRKRELQDFRVAGWRKDHRKNYYTSDKFDVADKWLRTLCEEDRQFVDVFCEKMLPGKNVHYISKDNSIACSVVDAMELADNFLNFVLENVSIESNSVAQTA